MKTSFCAAALGLLGAGLASSPAAVEASAITVQVGGGDCLEIYTRPPSVWATANDQTV